MKHFSPKAVIPHEQLGVLTYLDYSTYTGTPQNIKDVGGQKDAIALMIPARVSGTGNAIPYGVTFYGAKRSGFAAPGAGTIYARAWNYDSGALLATIGSMDANALSVVASDIYITLSPASVDLIKAGITISDYVLIGIQLIGGDAANYLIFDGAGAGGGGELGMVRTHGTATFDAQDYKFNIYGMYGAPLLYKYNPLNVDSLSL